MALRVLLADESTAIRKAILMVLADLGPEVKSVPSGLDVLSVTKSYRPDIILIDVLLSKKNGYEVSLELKTDPETQKIPVILMWSNFMQLDFTQFSNCKANDSIEKPFETANLRGKIERQLPQIKNHPLRGVLTMPRLPNMVEDDQFVKQKTTYQTLSQDERDNIRISQTQTPTFQFQPGEEMVSDEISEDLTPIVETEEEDLQNEENAILESLPEQPPLKTPSLKKQEEPATLRQTLPETAHQPEHQVRPNNEDWNQISTDQFVVQTENIGEEFEEVTSIDSLGAPSVQSQISDQIQNYLKDSPVTSQRQGQLKSKNHSSFDEQLLREEIRLTAERICWQIIPEVTERIVREELAKLLKGIENNT